MDADLADMAQQKADSLNLANIRFLVRNYDEAPPTKAFGLIFCADVLEHIPDDLGAIRCFRELLEPGGHLVVHVPCTGTWQLVCSCPGSRHSDPGHVRPEYNEQELTELLAQGGFSNIVVNRTFGPFGEAAFELNSLAWQHASLDRVVRRRPFFPSWLSDVSMFSCR